MGAVQNQCAVFRSVAPYATMACAFTAGVGNDHPSSGNNGGSSGPSSTVRTDSKHTVSSVMGERGVARDTAVNAGSGNMPAGSEANSVSVEAGTHKPPRRTCRSNTSSTCTIAWMLAAHGACENGMARSFAVACHSDAPVDMAHAAAAQYKRGQHCGARCGFCCVRPNRCVARGTRGAKAQKMCEKNK